MKRGERWGQERQEKIAREFARFKEASPVTGARDRVLNQIQIGVALFLSHAFQPFAFTFQPVNLSLPALYLAYSHSA